MLCREAAVLALVKVTAIGSARYMCPWSSENNAKVVKKRSPATNPRKRGRGGGGDEEGLERPYGISWSVFSVYKSTCFIPSK